MKRILHISLLGLLLALLGACSTPEVVQDAGGRTPMQLTVTPGYIRDGKIGEEYTFTLSATGLKGRSSNTATFKWSFSGGAQGEREVTFEDGKASTQVTQAFSEAGVYGLVAAVETDARAATGAAVISIGGAVPEREAELATCGDWVSKKEGAYGVTVDRWDISSVPAGAVFDLKFDTIGIPDRLVVEYPNERISADTGWRGDSKHDGGPLYPGGVVGGTTGEVRGMFAKGTDDSFTVTVFGPDTRTRWNYEVRCRIPGR